MKSLTNLVEKNHVVARMRADFMPKRQAFYCEENVWHLCQEPTLAHRPRYVVFVSNAERACPMWSQRAGRGRPIVWDYHVILLVMDPLEIWDVDTTLGLPVSARHYLEQTFSVGLPEVYWPLFRLVPAEDYIRVFSSDRSHMLEPNGKYKKPPPPWPTIGERGAPSNLMELVDMTRPFIGEVVSLPELWRRVAR